MRKRLGKRRARSAKLAPKFSTPWKVEKVQGSRVLLKRVVGDSEVQQWADASQLEFFKVPKLTRRYVPASDLDGWVKGGLGEHFVEAITSHRDTPSGREYEVTWEGQHDVRERRWLTRDAFPVEAPLLEEYERSLMRSGIEHKETALGSSIENALSKALLRVKEGLAKRRASAVVSDAIELSVGEPNSVCAAPSVEGVVAHDGGAAPESVVPSSELPLATELLEGQGSRELQSDGVGAIQPQGSKAKRQKSGADRTAEPKRVHFEADGRRVTREGRRVDYARLAGRKVRK